MLQLLLTAVHVFAVTLWIGSITASGWLLANQRSAPSPAQAKAAAELAYGLYRKLATPAFGMAFATGIGVVMMASQYYMKAHWFHGKLTLALAVIALHHILGAKVRKASEAAESAQSAEQVGPPSNAPAILTAALVLCALGAVVLVVFKGALIS